MESAKEANHSSKYKLSNTFVYLPALIAFIANSSNSVSLKSLFCASDYRKKIIINTCRWKTTLYVDRYVHGRWTLNNLWSFWLLLSGIVVESNLVTLCIGIKVKVEIAR